MELINWASREEIEAWKNIYKKYALGYELADCICGGKPKLDVIHMVPDDGGFCEVRCPRCGRSSGMFVDEKDAVFRWNMYMKRRPKDYL